MHYMPRRYYLLWWETLKKGAGIGVKNKKILFQTDQEGESLLDIEVQFGAGYIHLRTLSITIMFKARGEWHNLDMHHGYQREEAEGPMSETTAEFRDPNEEDDAAKGTERSSQGLERNS